MSIRQLKARLDRLERLDKLDAAWKLPYGFVIDPALAKAIRQEIDRIREISFLNFAFGAYGAETSDQRAISARIDQMTKSICCPSEYDWEQYNKDEHRLGDLYYKSITPRSCLTRAEVAEEDQLIVRREVFSRKTPKRKADVSEYERSYKKKTLTAEEDKELSRLKSFCKVTPISAGQPTVICDDPIVSKHPKFNPGKW